MVSAGNHKEKMSTPYMILAGWGKSITISMWVIWVSTLILSRVYAFHEAYISESQRLMDEKYLLEKCQVSFVGPFSSQSVANTRH